MFKKKRINLAVTSAMGATAAFMAAPNVSAQGQQIVEEVVVTGSRIARADFTSNSPVATVGAEQFQLTGTINTENLMNTLPQAVPGFDSSSNNPGDGTATVNLRGLGAFRTLVMMDGVRVTPSSAQGVVDLNNIPSAMIERVEVVTGGASAVYGSDAIAGVVNFIMKKDFEGIDVSFGNQLTQEGDAENKVFNFTLGGNFADGRGNAVMALSYNDRDPLFAAERDYSSVANFDNVAENRFDVGGSSARPGTAILTGSRKFEPDGSISPFVTPDDLYNYAPVNYLQLPQERFQVSTFGRFDLTENHELYARGTFARSQVDQQLAPTPFGFDGPLAITVEGNPFITPGAQQILRDNYDTATDANGNEIPNTVAIQSRSRVTRPRRAINTRDMLQFVFGARGDLADNISYDVYFSEGRFESNLTQEGNISLSKLNQGLLLDTSDPENITCQDQSGGCVPLNIYGEGNLTPEMEDFIGIRVNAATDITQRVFHASLAGDTGSFQLPGGAIGFAAGYDFVLNDVDYRPSQALAVGDSSGFNATPPLSGGYHSKELFAEFYAPILSGAQFAEVLAVEGAYRSSDYTTVGRVDAWKIAGEWAPIEDVRFRASFNTAVRAPNINELFRAQAFAAPSAVDPCSAVAFDSGLENPEAVRATCLATGVPADAVFTADVNAPASQVRGLFGGNPDLKEEEAETTTLGVVVSPSAVPGLTVSLDYFQVEIEDRIASFGGGVANILDLCYTDQEVGGVGSAFCNAVNRFGDGSIEFVAANDQNIASSTLKGFDLMAEYGWENRLGTWDVAYMATITDENSFESFEGAESVDCAGKFGNQCSGIIGTLDADYRHRTTLRWSNNSNLTAQLVWQHIGETSDTAESGFVTLDIDSYNYFDGSVSYTFNDTYRATFGVNNILDEDPPLLGFNSEQSNTYPSVFDPYGRMFFLNVGATF